MITYWKIRLNYNRIRRQGYYDYVYIHTDKPLSARSIPLEAVRQKMLIDSFMCRVDQVTLVTKEEYFRYMWE